MVELGEHFTACEFYCPCGRCGLGLPAMEPALLRLLQAAREVAGVPFAITSSIRCRAHNAAVGGVDSSAHMGGWAVDIAAADSHRRHRVVWGALGAGFRRIGIGSTFVHLDCDPGKAGDVMWTY